MAQNKYYGVNRVFLIIRLIMYCIPLMVLLYNTYSNYESRYLTLYIIIIFLFFGAVCSDIFYFSKDVLLAKNSIFFISVSYYLFRFPKKIEIPFSELKHLEIRELATHGILISFTSNKTHLLFAGDISRLDNFIDELKTRIPKTCATNGLLLNEPPKNKHRVVFKT